MQREGVFREMKLRRSYEKPSEKKAREKSESIRRSRKLERKRRIVMGFQLFVVDIFIIRGKAMAKPTIIQIRLESTAGTGTFYVTKKNPRTLTEKMVKKKYDPKIRKHVEFKERKID